MKTRSIFTSFTNFSLIIVIAVFGTLLSFVLFNALKPAKADAAAAIIYHDPARGYMIRACKISTAYGYILRTHANKPANTTSNASIQSFVYSPSGQFLGSKSSSTWLSNTWAWVDLPAGGDMNTFDAILSINTSPSQIMSTSRVLMYYVPYC